MTDKAKAAADLILGHWQAGTYLDAIPAEIRPSDRAEAYAVQAHVERLTKHRLFGWKIAATSLAGQKHINVGGPLAGRIIAEKVFTEDSAVPLGANRMLVAEAEFAFRMGEDLAPREREYGVDEVMAAVETLFLAIEVPNSRFSDFCAVGEAQLIADNACADQFVLGPEAHASWRDIDLAAHEVTGTVAGKTVHEGRGANVLGDPRIALAWIANELSRHGMTLRADEIVTTGTCVVPLPIAPGDTVTADYGALGTMTVRFAA